MKKVMIISVFAASLSLAAPMSNAMVPQNTQPEITMTQGDEVTWTEITVDKVPEEVSTTFQGDYAGYVIDKAYKGDDGTYKLKVSKDTEKLILVYTEEGEFVKTMTKDDMKKDETAPKE